MKPLYSNPDQMTTEELYEALRELQMHQDAIKAAKRAISVVLDQRSAIADAEALANADAGTLQTIADAGGVPSGEGFGTL